MDPVQDDIRQFLDTNITAIDQLDILRVLAEDPSREWGAADLGKAAQTAPDAVAAHVGELAARGLLAARTHEGILLARHGPATPELQRQLGQVLQAYRERPVSLIRIVYSQANQRLRSFADAFKLRKEG